MTLVNDGNKVVPIIIIVIIIRRRGNEHIKFYGYVSRRQSFYSGGRPKQTIKTHNRRGNAFKATSTGWLDEKPKDPRKPTDCMLLLSTETRLFYEHFA